MKITTRNVQFRDPNGRMVSSAIIANGSLHDEVVDYLDNNPQALGDAVVDATESWLAENITEPSQPAVDASLSVTGAAADAKKVGDELSDLKSEIALNSGIPRQVKLAIDNILQNVAFKNDTDYSADKSAIHAWVTSVQVTAISAVYTQTKPVYAFYELDLLRDDLVITATYDNGTSGEVSAYTLSGTLTEGTSTITASYEGFSATFNVTVTGKEFTYTASDGVLIDQPYFHYWEDERMTVTATSDSTDGTHIVIPKVSGSYWGKAAQAGFNFTESAHLTAEFKIAQIGYYGSTNTNSPGVIAFNITNGTQGSMVGFARDGSASANVKIRTAQEAVVAKGESVSLNEWHTLDIVFANGKQTVTLDGNEVITNATPTSGKSNYIADTGVGFSSNQTAETNVYYRNITYSAV